MEVYTDVNYAGSMIDRRSASNYYTFGGSLLIGEVRSKM